MILVDTSIWIDFLRGENSLERRLLHKLIEDEEEISITGIILTEILQGIKENKKYQITKNYLLTFPMYEASGINTYIDAARIYRECRNNGRTIRSTIDCIIAAICLENDLSVLHKDRDYDIIKECVGLKVVKVDV
jgi:predicted nucleic acid-binding protein